MKIKWTDIAENFVKEGTDINGNKVFGAINNTWTWDQGEATRMSRESIADIVDELELMDLIEDGVYKFNDVEYSTPEELIISAVKNYLKD